jgi:dephospho-CoA kinase
MLFNQEDAIQPKMGTLMINSKLVIGISGMPGAGKSLFVEAAKESGYAIITMGDVIRQETLKRGLELNPQNVGKVMLQLREEGGNTVIAQKCVPLIEAQGGQKVIVDGLRSLFEADTFKANFSDFILCAVHASPETRFKRLNCRGRSDDPKTYDVFHERDMRELGVGLGNVIAMSTLILVNDDGMEQFKAQVKDSLKGIEEKWLK